MATPEKQVRAFIGSTFRDMHAERSHDPAMEVYQATQEQYLGDDMLFGFVNSVTQGLALMRGSELGVDVRALVLHDPGSPAAFGGTRYFLDQWQALGRPADEIDLANLRRAIPDAAMTQTPRIRRMAAKTERVRGRRKLMAMLFAEPVYPADDPVIGKQNYFGANVNRAARIEPVTAPGCAYASEQFAAMLAVTPGHNFRCEFIGKEELAKNYDQCRLYRLI